MNFFVYVIIELLQTFNCNKRVNFRSRIKICNTNESE